MSRSLRVVVLTAFATCLAGCGTGQVPLMTTPVIYGEGGVDPLAHLDDADRTTTQTVFFATNRARLPHRYNDPASYGNTPTDTLQVGKVRVAYGDGLAWPELSEASRLDPREDPVPIFLTDIWEYGSLRFDGVTHVPDPTDGSDRFFADVNAQLARAEDPELIIYVHGAKVDFYNGCVFAAELNHFAGRDMVAIALAWPTHQDIFRYLDGEDVERAITSANAFAAFLHTLADRTDARRINIVCWSAGGRVVSRALETLEVWEERAEADPSAARIGTVVFAAPDVPIVAFLERLPRIERIAERVIITASDDDIALQKASQFMGGGRRVGALSEGIESDELEAMIRLDRIEIVDVSGGKDRRGFDIGGHRYWYQHPWVASDVILAVRTRRPARERGLEAGAYANVWYLPSDYPERAKEAARRALGEAWK